MAGNISPSGHPREHTPPISRNTGSGSDRRSDTLLGF